MADETDTTTKVARVLLAHDAERMACMDHDGACCPTCDAHDFADAYKHQAEALAAAGLLREPGLEAVTPSQLAQEEVTPAVRRAAEENYMTRVGSLRGVPDETARQVYREAIHAHHSWAEATRPILAAAFAGKEIARQLCEQTGPAAYHGPVPCDEHSLAVAVVRDVMLGGDQSVNVLRGKIIGDGS